MKNFLKPGKTIAFIISSLLVFMVWGLIYQPGGLAANILLGIALAIMTIYYGTKNLGAFLDDLLFNGGSREKAMLMRRARVELKLFREKLAKKKRWRIRKESEFLNLEKSLNELEEHVLSPNPNLTSVKKTLGKVDLAAKAFLGKLPRKGLLGSFESLTMALLGAIALRILIVEPFQIPSGSMIPTLLVGDHLFVSKLSYGIMNPLSSKPSYLIRWASPTPGEVMIFEAPSYVPSNAGQTWIKRVIATAGQRVKIREGMVYVNEVPYPHLEKNKLIRYWDYFMSHNLWRELGAFENKERIGFDTVHQIYMNDPEESWPRTGQQKLPGLDCDADSCLVEKDHIFVMGDNRGGSADSRLWGALPVENVKGRALFVWMSVNGRKQAFSLGSFSLPEFRWSRWFREIK